MKDFDRNSSSLSNHRSKAQDNWNMELRQNKVLVHASTTQNLKGLWKKIQFQMKLDEKEIFVGLLSGENGTN